MKFKKLFDGTEIPVLGIGTWKIGEYEDPDPEKEKVYVEALKYAISQGLTHIDTAEIYANGYTERIVSKSIASFEREELFITSKIWETHLKYNDVIKFFKQSLDRLCIKYLDLFLIHKPNPSVPLKETIKALDYLKDQQLVKNIGVSNFSLELLKEAQSYSRHKITANQVEYNLINRTAFEDIPYYQKNKIILIAYRPLARGSLADSPSTLLQTLSEKYNKTKAQIALNWLISQEQVITIPKASKKNHIDENIDSLNFSLDKSDIEKLNKLN